MRIKLRVIFRVIIAMVLIGFYVFRWRTGTLPVGIPLRLQVLNVEVKSGQETNKTYPVTLTYDNGIKSVDGTCANLFIGKNNIGKKTIIELQVKNLFSGETDRWVYGVFNN